MGTYIHESNNITFINDEKKSNLTSPPPPPSPTSTLSSNSSTISQISTTSQISTISTTSQISTISPHSPNSPNSPNSPKSPNDKKHNKTIIKELNKFKIPDNIKLQADLIYNKLNLATRRGKRRKQMLFFCIYNAYKELNIPPFPIKIAEIVGLKKNEINKSFSMFSELQTGYKPRNLNLTALDMLPELCKSLGFNDNDIELCISVGKEIIDNDIKNNSSNLNERLDQEYPQVVATGILRYFTEINGIDINKKKFADNVCISDNAIKNIKDKVSMIHNM